MPETGPRGCTRKGFCEVSNWNRRVGLCCPRYIAELQAPKVGCVCACAGATPVKEGPYTRPAVRRAALAKPANRVVRLCLECTAPVENSLRREATRRNPDFRIFFDPSTHHSMDGGRVYRVACLPRTHRARPTGRCRGQREAQVSFPVFQETKMFCIILGLNGTDRTESTFIQRYSPQALVVRGCGPVGSVECPVRTLVP